MQHAWFAGDAVLTFKEFDEASSCWRGDYRNLTEPLPIFKAVPQDSFADTFNLQPRIPVTNTAKVRERVKAVQDLLFPKGLEALLPLPEGCVEDKATKKMRQLREGLVWFENFLTEEEDFASAEVAEDREQATLAWPTYQQVSLEGEAGMLLEALDSFNMEHVSTLPIDSKTKKKILEVLEFERSCDARKGRNTTAIYVALREGKSPNTSTFEPAKDAKVGHYCLLEFRVAEGTTFNRGWELAKIVDIIAEPEVVFRVQYIEPRPPRRTPWDITASWPDNEEWTKWTMKEYTRNRKIFFENVAPDLIVWSFQPKNNRGIKKTDVPVLVGQIARVEARLRGVNAEHYHDSDLEIRDMEDDRSDFNGAETCSD